MAPEDNNLPTLPEAELYMLIDDRSDRDFLSNRGNQYADDPAASEALRQAHHARWRAMDPTWKPGKQTPTSIRGEHNFPFTPNLAPRAAAFKRNMPRALPHYDLVGGCGYDPLFGGLASGTITVVSTSWKSAIESVEPGVHEFFPFEFRFRDRVATDHFMFRNRQFLDLVDPTGSHGDGLTAFDGTFVWSLRVRPDFVTAKRGVVLGHHWMQHQGHPPSPHFYRER